MGVVAFLMICQDRYYICISSYFTFTGRGRQASAFGVLSALAAPPRFYYMEELSLEEQELLASQFQSLVLETMVATAEEARDLVFTRYVIREHRRLHDSFAERVKTLTHGKLSKPKFDVDRALSIKALQKFETYEKQNRIETEINDFFDYNRKEPIDMKPFYSNYRRMELDKLEELGYLIDVDAFIDETFQVLRKSSNLPSSTRQVFSTVIDRCFNYCLQYLQIELKKKEEPETSDSPSTS